jgi:antitoxin ParD1/3/4
MTMTVDLGPQLEKFVNEMIESGRYGSKSEVLREGVRLVQDREARLAHLKAAIEKGLADADAGRLYDLEDVARDLQHLYQPLPGVAEE